MPNPLAFLGNLPVQQFLDEYWQKKPLLIRNAFPELESPLDADELAGLALEPEVESRLILENGKAGPWELETGPFDEQRFQQLPEKNWTLLVQAVDQWVPEVEELLDYFRFIPSWRLDDIMFSYAPEGGSVGPHFDQYDVFLLQTSGQRHWQLGQTCDAKTPRLNGTCLDIIEGFEATDDWVLNPGDMLYIPPQLAHWGIAQGDECITMSVGFRAPSHADILSDFSQEIASQLTEDQRYKDFALNSQAPSGEISPAAIDNIKNILQHYVDNTEELSHWFGRLMTAPKYEDPQPLTEEAFDLVDLYEDLSNGAYLQRHSGSRLAYSRKPDNTSLATLYFDGSSQLSGIDLAKLLCDKRRIEFEDIGQLLDTDLNEQLLQTLLSLGVFFVEE